MNNAHNSDSYINIYAILISVLFRKPLLAKYIVTRKYLRLQDVSHNCEEGISLFGLAPENQDRRRHPYGPSWLITWGNSMSEIKMR
jgi:hypothetical protein